MRPPLTSPESCCWTMSDGCAIHGRLWTPPPDTPPARAILYLHGIQSHGGWFEWSASVLAQSGHLVVLPDRRGSGLNQQDRGDTPSAERWLADIDEIAAWIEQQYRIARISVIGVSWGGKLAAAWALRNTSRIEKLLLVAPGVFPAVDVSLATRLHIGWSLLFNSRRLFPIPLDDPALFTDNPAARAFIANDPLKLTHATARFLYHSSRLDRQLGQLPSDALPMPVTLALAQRERIIRNAPTEAWLRRLTAQPITVRTFAAAHTLEFESDPAEYDALLREWAAARE